MAIVVVGGSAKDIGKTALMCAIIAALRDLNWTAVKISGHDYQRNSSDGSGPVVFEETSARQETDTARYLAAGARRALLVARTGNEVPMNEIRRAIADDCYVIVESNRIIDAIKPDVCIALVGDGPSNKPSFQRLLRVADAVVNAGIDARNVPAGAMRFQFESNEPLPEDMVAWLRKRLEPEHQQPQ